LTDLKTDLAQSREFEMQTYLTSVSSMYSTAMAQNEEIYDIASAATDAFRDVSAPTILSDSRMVRILRYTVAPSISQMKFGQFFGLNSVGQFEAAKLLPGSIKYERLEGIAGRMAQFVNDNIDRRRFLWLDASVQVPDQSLAEQYAKRWTCSIAADQNAQTRYRNWRKDQQESAIAAALIGLGYVKSAHSGTVSKKTDVSIGEFTPEKRVKGRTMQKADVIVRSKRVPHPLVLIEAKAVGVELDSTKRIKECCDKAGDWGSSTDLDAPTVVSVIAGFFNEKGIQNLRASGIEVVWEHRLTDLADVL
jgi:hypothetical protein